MLLKWRHLTRFIPSAVAIVVSLQAFEVHAYDFNFRYEQKTRSTQKYSYETFLNLDDVKFIDFSDYDPLLKKSIDALMKRLNHAQKVVYERREGNFKVKSVKTQFRLFEDPDINAFYYSRYRVETSGFIFTTTVDQRQLFFEAMKRAKYANIQNCIAVSTGFLRTLLKTPKDTELLAAAILHEMGHGIDDYSINSLGRDNKYFETHKKVHTLQAEELKEDFEGTQMLSEAHIDPSAMARLQQVLTDIRDRQNAGKVERAATDGANTHPEQIFRQSINRVSSLLDRYENGWNEPIPLEVEVPLNEVQKLPMKDKVLFHVDLDQPILNGEELFKNFARYFTQSKEKEFESYTNEVRFNYLIAEFDRLLLAGELDDSVNRKATAHLLATIAAVNMKDSSHAYFYSTLPSGSVFRPMIRDEIPGIYFGNGQAREVSHPITLDEAPYLQSEDFMQSFFEELDLVNPLHFEHLISRKAEINPILMAIPSIHRLKYLEKIPHILNKLDPYGSDPKNDSVRDFVLKMFDSLSVTDRSAFLSYLLKQGGGSPLRLSKLFVLLQGEELGPIIAWKNSKWTDLNTNDSPQFRQLAKDIWASRQRFGIAELFLSNDRRIRWEWIFKVVGITEAEGLRQLRSSMFDYLRSEEYRKFYRFLRDGILIQDGSSLKLRVLGTALNNLSDAAMIWPKKSRVWLTETNLNELDGHSIENLSLYEKKLMQATMTVRGFQLEPGFYRKKFKERFQYYFNQNDQTKLTGETVVTLWARSYADIAGVDVNLKPIDGDFSFRRDSDFLNGMNLPERNLFDYSIRWRTTFMLDLDDLSDILLEVVSPSKMSDAEKKVAISEILILPTRNIYSMSNPLYNSKVFTSPRLPEVESRLKEQGLQFEGYGNATSYTTQQRKNFYKNSSQSMKARITSDVQGKKPFDEVLKLFSSIWSGSAKKVSSPDIDQFKSDVIAVLKSSSYQPNELLTLMACVTRDGATTETDDYIVSMIPNLVDGDYLKFKTNGGEFSSEGAAQIWVRSWVKNLKAGAEHLDEKNLAYILEQVGKLLPTPSFSRDDLLEEIAWDCPVASDYLFKKLEDLKSYKLDPFSNPNRVNVVSMVSSYLQGFGENEIDEWILHVQDHPGEAMTDEMRSKLWRRLLNDAPALQIIRQIHPNQTSLSNAELADLGVRYTDELLTALRGDDRIPFIDHLIHSGLKPISNKPHFEFYFAEKYLAYTPGSQEAKFLRAFLASVPEHEYSVTISYLSAKKHGGDQKLRISPLFEPFKTPGKKAAQAYATFRLGDDESIREAATFKSGAKPMSKWRMKEILKAELPKSEYEKIISLYLVSSASLKTVARFEDTIVAVVDPRAEQQNYTHMAFLKKFVANLEKEGVFADAALVKNLLQSIENQLIYETDQKREARILTELQPLIEKLNRKYENQWKGWTLAIPKVSSEFTQAKHVLFMSRAPGVTFDKLSETEQAEAGQIVIDGSLGLTFEGRAEGDPHVGNVMVDSRGKIVTLIDKGQDVKLDITPFRLKADDRTQISAFLLALSKMDASKLVTAAVAMSDRQDRTPEELLKARNAVDAFFRTLKNASAQTAIDLFKILVSQGIELRDAFSVGLLKGMMTLERENYVTPLQFQASLQEHISAHILQKRIPVIFEFCKARRITNPELSVYSCVLQSYEELKSLKSDTDCVDDMHTHKDLNQ